MLFGLLGPLLNILPKVTLVRIRRDRVSTAVSYWEEDKIPCSGRGMFVLCPFWHGAALAPTLEQWHRLSDVQKCLWMVDEVEVRLLSSVKAPAVHLATVGPQWSQAARHCFSSCVFFVSLSLFSSRPFGRRCAGVGLAWRSQRSTGRTERPLFRSGK